jgi:hypothetical protein
MDMREIARRTAWQAGTSTGLADQVIEAFLHEVGQAVRADEEVDLGAFGRIRRDGSFAPGPAMTTTTAVGPLVDTSGYDEGTAPSDS